ncbi:MAG: carboxymuconolactone decarboxylase family protein [Cytophagales bacterium]|nr:carboxymuconolactone decarboxylase family protein [Cytophagales bacterium]
MSSFAVPTREDVSPQNQVLFDNLKGALGFVPNLYATIAYSGNALGNYLQFQNGKTSLSKKEKEVVNLVVSQVNECAYCLAAHTALGRMNGLTDGQMLEIRQGSALFQPKLDALVKLTREITLHKGRIAEAHLDAFYAAGYTNESLVDVIAAIGDKVIMNYLHNLTQVPVDFPPAPQLNAVEA